MTTTIGPNSQRDGGTLLAPRAEARRTGGAATSLPAELLNRAAPRVNPAGIAQIVNAMTVDVEDYFQVSAFSSMVAPAEWDRYPCRVERNVDAILQMFTEHGVKATFFVLGWIGRRYPTMLTRIVTGGHELASHGYRHVLVHRQSPEQFRADVIKTKEILEDIGGVPVRGYRAASFSIDERTPWAFDVLGQTGHAYTSSVYPIRHDLYGMPRAPRFVFAPAGSDGPIEIPVSTVSFLGHNLPCGGGGYFRLLPYTLSRWAIRRVNRAEGQPCIFYFHPWEIDPGQPRFEGIPLKTRIRHYTNLGRMKRRLHAVLSDFAWDRVDRIYLGGEPGGEAGAR